MISLLLMSFALAEPTEQEENPPATQEEETSTEEQDPDDAEFASFKAIMQQ